LRVVQVSKKIFNIIFYYYDEKSSYSQFACYLAEFDMENKSIGIKENGNKISPENHTLIDYKLVNGVVWSLWASTEEYMVYYGTLFIDKRSDFISENWIRVTTLTDQFKENYPDSELVLDDNIREKISRDLIKTFGKSLVEQVTQKIERERDRREKGNEVEIVGFQNIFKKCLKKWLFQNQPIGFFEINSRYSNIMNGIVKIVKSKLTKGKYGITVFRPCEPLEVLQSSLFSNNEKLTFENLIGKFI
jgi:hypothetical protein